MQWARRPSSSATPVESGQSPNPSTQARVSINSLGCLIALDGPVALQAPVTSAEDITASWEIRDAVEGRTRLARSSNNSCIYRTLSLCAKARPGSDVQGKERSERVNAVVQQVDHAKSLPKLIHKCLVVGSSQTVLQQTCVVMVYEVGQQDTLNKIDPQTD